MSLAATQFREIVDILRPHWPKDAAIPPPASETEIQATMRHVGQSLPDSLLDVYRIQNGSPKSASDPLVSKLFYNYTFLSLSDMRQEFDHWARVRHPPEFDLVVPSRPGGVVLEHYSMTGWIPFAKDGGGNCLAIDYSPGPVGAMCQVINFGPDDTTAHFQLGTDFEDFLLNVHDAYREGDGHFVFGFHGAIVDRLLGLHLE